MPFEIDEDKLNNSINPKPDSKLGFIEKVSMSLFVLGFFVIFWGGIVLLLKYIF